MSTTIYHTLKRLVEWSGPSTARVLSLYLDLTGRGGQDPLDRAEEACKQLLAGTPAGEGALGELTLSYLAKLPAALERSRELGYGGLALFLCAHPRLEERVRVRLPLPNAAALRRRPALRHLLALAEEYERTVCAVVGPVSARVCEIHVGDLVAEREVKASQRRQMPQELAAALARMVREDHLLHVVLMGAPEDRVVAEEALSQDVRARIIDRVDRAIAPDDPEHLLVVQRCLQAYERRAEAAGVARLLRLPHEEQEVAIGLRATLDAINRGRLKVLYVLQRWEEQGWLCEACSCLGALPAPPFCLACDAPVKVVPLEEHVIDQAAACGAEIETVKESQLLGDLGGIGALIDEPMDR